MENKNLISEENKDYIKIKEDLALLGIKKAMMYWFIPLTNSSAELREE